MKDGSVSALCFLLLINKMTEVLILNNTFLKLRLSEDTAWHPVREEKYESKTALRKAIVFGYGPFRPWMSIAHW
jgi:hypothetical protein